MKALNIFLIETLAVTVVGLLVLRSPSTPDRSALELPTVDIVLEEVLPEDFMLSQPMEFYVQALEEPSPEIKEYVLHLSQP